MNYWLVKTEPNTYSWDDLIKDKHTSWTGVRNFQARIHLRTMKKDDLVFVYHSGAEKSIKGIAKIIKVAHKDTTATDGDWVTVELAPIKPLSHPVSLSDIKKHAKLKNMVLVKNSRLSVQPVTKDEWNTCLSIYGN